jgi:hypothetical protein
VKRRAVAACLGGVLLLMASPVQSLFAQAETTTQISVVPLDGTIIQNPCNGEAVTLAGTFLLLVHETLDAQSGDHFHYLISGQGVSGVGEQTELTYRLTSPSPNLHLNSTSADGLSYTLTNAFHLVSATSALNFTEKSVFHVTVNSEGSATATVSNISTECI